MAKLTAPDGAADDHFGGDVSISGDAIVVGALDHEGAAGAAYIFERNHGGRDAWGAMEQADRARRCVRRHLRGIVVGIDGNQVAVGTSGDDDNGDASGAVYAFRRTGEGWEEIERCNAGDAASSDWLGESIAVDGDTMVVSASGDDDGGSSSGAAYVFQRNHATADGWDQVAKLVASDARSDDDFGNSVDISHGTVVVGARRKGIGEVGAAYVFQRNEGGADAWGEVVKLVPSDGEYYDHFGTAVAIDNDSSWSARNGRPQH